MLLRPKFFASGVILLCPFVYHSDHIVMSYIILLTHLFSSKLICFTKCSAKLGHPAKKSVYAFCLPSLSSSLIRVTLRFIHAEAKWKPSSLYSFGKFRFGGHWQALSVKSAPAGCFVFCFQGNSPKSPPYTLLVERLNKKLAAWIEWPEEFIKNDCLREIVRNLTTFNDVLVNELQLYYWLVPTIGKDLFNVWVV